MGGGGKATERKGNLRERVVEVGGGGDGVEGGGGVCFLLPAAR